MRIDTFEKDKSLNELPSVLERKVKISSLSSLGISLRVNGSRFEDVFFIAVCACKKYQ